MIQKKHLPNGIQFTFDNLNDPGSIELMVNLSVYLTHEHTGLPLLYAVILTFMKNDQEDCYEFCDLVFDCCYHVDLYDVAQLEHQLKGRLMELLEPCKLDIYSPLKNQLMAFLEEYGGGDKVRFML